MYGLIGKIIAVDGSRDELAGILHHGSRAMAGCLSYVVALDAADDNTLWVTELWETREKHAASLSLPTVQEAIAKGRPLIAGFGQRIETIPFDGHD